MTRFATRRPVVTHTITYDSGRDLARAVLVRAFMDAVDVIPPWSTEQHVKRRREAKEDALAFLLSRSPDRSAMREFWFRLAEREEPDQRVIIAAIERHAALTGGA